MNESDFSELGRWGLRSGRQRIAAAQQAWRDHDLGAGGSLALRHAIKMSVIKINVVLG
jgi:hypothetical protein